MGGGALVPKEVVTTIALRLLSGWVMLFLAAILYAGGAALFDTLDAAARGEIPWRLVLPCLDRLTPRVFFNAVIWSSVVWWGSMAMVLIAMWVSDRFRTRAQE